MFMVNKFCISVDIQNESAVYFHAAKRQALAPVIEGVVVPLVVMVTLVAVGAIIIAGYIVHKRSKNHRGESGKANLFINNLPTLFISWTGHLML